MRTFILHRDREEIVVAAQNAHFKRVFGAEVAGMFQAIAQQRQEAVAVTFDLGTFLQGRLAGCSETARAILEAVAIAGGAAAASWDLRRAAALRAADDLGWEDASLDEGAALRVSKCIDLPGQATWQLFFTIPDGMPTFPLSLEAIIPAQPRKFEVRFRFGFTLNDMFGIGCTPFLSAYGTRGTNSNHTPRLPFDLNERVFVALLDAIKECAPELPDTDAQVFSLPGRYNPWPEALL